MTIRVYGEIHSSKNSRRVVPKSTGGVVVLKSKASKADEGILSKQLNLYRGEWDRMVEGTVRDIGPLYVVFVFHRKTRAKWDFINLVQGVADAMVKAGYLKDDDTAHFIPVYGGEVYDPENPGVEMWIRS